MVYSEVELISPPTEVTGRLPYNVVVSGYVRRYDTKEPIPNARVDINFNGIKATTYTNSSGFFSKTFTVYEYGGYFIDVIATPPDPNIKRSGHYKTFYIWDPEPLPAGNYYWVGLRMLVNGVEVEDYAPVYPGDQVVIEGKLYRDGSPVPNAWISMGFIMGSMPYVHTKTDSNGYFKFVTTAPDWKAHYLCGEKLRYCHINTEPDTSGYPAASWEFFVTAVCPELPNPVFQDAWFEVGGTRYNAGSTIEIPPGTSITAKATIVNNGGAGDVYFYVYDARANKYVRYTSKYMNKGETWTPSITFTPSGDADYELHVAYKSVDGNIYVTDKVGCEESIINYFD